MNGCISFIISPINTELENVADFNVLVLTIWVSYCLSNNNRLVPSPFRFETWPCPSLPSVATDYRRQFHNLVPRVFSLSNMAVAYLLSCHSHIGKRENPEDEVGSFNANLVLPVPTERERERRENLGTKQCLKINSNNNTGLLFFWNSTDAKTRLDFLKIKQPNEFRCHTFSMTFVGLSLFLQVCREGHIVSIVWLYLFRPCSPL